MKITSLGGDDALFDMTPMMDIVFQLIAFFMIVATYVTREKVEVDLPMAVNAAMAENQRRSRQSLRARQTSHEGLPRRGYR